MNRFYAYFLLVLLVALLPTAAQAQTIPVTLPTESGQPGQSRNLVVTANFGANDIVGYSLTFTYDPSVLTIDETAITPGPLSSPGSFGAAQTTPGTITLAFFTAGTETGSGTLFTIPADLDAAGISSLTLTGTFTPDGGGSIPADDGAGGSVTVNTPPTARNDNASTDTNVAITISVLSNDSANDPGQTLTIDAIVSGPSDGTAVPVSGDTQVLYTPNTGFGGNDSFVYRVIDDLGGTDQATVNIFVDSTPTANDDNTTAGVNQTIVINVLQNDTNGGDGETLTITNVTAPTAGTATIIQNGTRIQYTPPGNFVGQVTFDYTIEDESNNTDMATVTIDVVGNRNPIPRDDTATTLEATPVNISVLANDSDPDGDPLTVSGIPGLPSNGTAAIIDSGQRVRYTPNAGFSGNDQFTYQVSDGQGGLGTAVVVITVNPRPNNPPQAGNDAATTSLSTAVDIDVLANDSDPDGDPLTIDAISMAPANGAATITGGKVRYTPNAGFSGTDTFKYVAADGRGGTDDATVTVTVLANAPPNANDDAATTPRDTAVDIDVLANDSDPDGDPLTIDAVSDPPNGAAAIGGGMVTYTPDAGFSGVDTFTYTISDAVGNTDAATVTVTVLAPTTFQARLSGANEVPANSQGGPPTNAAKASAATGSFTAVLDGNQLAVTGSFSGLASNYAASHIHRGFAGQNGPVVFPLSPTVNADGRSGTFAQTLTLTADQVGDLNARRYYVNVHSAGLPAGVLRGQLVPAGAVGQYRVVLSGRAQVPSNGSKARGGAVIELRGDELIVSGAFSGLSSPYAASHIHRADIGANGPVVFPLNPTLDADNLGGVYAPANNTFTVDASQRSAFLAGLNYINVHSADFPPGEVRGQALPRAHRIFEFSLAGENEVSPVESGGVGGGIAVFNGVAGLRVAGNFAGLSSDYAASHLHGAPAGQNGPVLHALTPVLDPDNRGGRYAPGDNTFELSAEEAEMLFADGIYVNVHSMAHPPGELRGQVLASTNVAPAASAILSPVAGAMVDVMGDPATPFVVTWDAAADPNGNPVLYRWQLAADANFSTVLFEAPASSIPSFETTFGTVGTLLTANGVGTGQSVTLFHRAVNTDGSVSAAGAGASVTLTRGTLTDVQDAADVPSGFAVYGNYPNPFNPSTSIRVDLPQAAEVQVEVYNLLGQRLLATPAQPFAAGNNQAVQIDAASLPSGTYLYRVVARTQGDTFVGSGRMVLVK